MTIVLELDDKIPNMNIEMKQVLKVRHKNDTLRDIMRNLEESNEAQSWKRSTTVCWKGNSGGRGVTTASGGKEGAYVA
ncbi:hypothetical protein SK128_025311 [Halocaridina rubra]|uniref:Uncharacterized protein n=1 Tax=Halocaridina rubra TaxID=373956 RepID=A0AAN9A8Q2_HALRR